jgi:hypothetical protein
MHSPTLLPAILLASLLAAGVLPAANEESSSPAADSPTAPRKGGKEVPLLSLPDSYTELYKAILGSPESSKRPGFKTDAALASVAVRLWERTHDEKYRKIASEEFAKAVNDPAFSLADFHILHHFGELIWRMKRDGLLTPDQQLKLSKFAQEELAKYLKQPDDTTLPPGVPLYNIRIAQILGYAGLLRFLEGEPFDQREAVRKRVNDYLDLIIRLGNTDEDAANYDSLGLAFAIDLARLLGRENELKSPGLRRYFENYRDIVTPSGIIPEYGDAYFTYEDLPMDRVFLMEEAARLYDDPTFLAALRSMRNRPQRGLPSDDHWIRSLSLIDMPNSPMKAQPITKEPSEVLLRNAFGSNAIATVPDKLILRTGRDPGDSMVMMDLYASGSHAHRDKGPSIAYYESAQVPLFHNMGRHGSRSAIDGNICWALPAGQDFPGIWQPDRWFTWNYPVFLCPTNATGETILPKMMGLRNFPERNRDSTSLAFDNLRLTGSLGTLPIDGFDSPDGWSKNLAKLTPPVSSPDKTEGSSSQLISWNKVATQVLGRTFPKPPAPFSKDRHPMLQMDVKYEGIKPYMLIRGLGEEVELGAQVLRPRLVDASVEQRGRDSLGQVSYEGYITPDSKLTRRLLLTSEGYLVIRDTLTPGPSMEGWSAGQLWQFYTMSTHGDHWFCSAEEGAYPDVTKENKAGDLTTTRHMLVRFAGDGGTAAGFEEVRQQIVDPNPKGLARNSFFTTFSRRTVHSGHAEVFSMVVVPNDPRSMTAEELAKNVSVNQSSVGASEAVITPGTNRVTVHLGEKEWSVKR